MMQEHKTITRKMKLITASAWTGTIFLTLFFVVDLTWATRNSWVASVVASAVYTLVVFVAAAIMRRRKHSEDMNVDIDSMEPNMCNSMRTLMSLLFALGTISTGLTLFLLTVRIDSCSMKHFLNFSPEDKVEVGTKWITNTTTFPSDVAAWANTATSPDKIGAEFAYLPAADTVLFTGKTEEGKLPMLWMASNNFNSTPQVVSDITCPANFVVLRDGKTVCFTASAATFHESGETAKCDPFNHGYLICTTPGGHHSILNAVNPHEILVDDTVDGRIWYKTSAPNRTNDVFIPETLIYSADIGVFLTETLHSYQVSPSSDKPQCRNKKPGLPLLLSATLVIAISVIIYRKMGIPSMPVCIHLGLTGVIMSIYCITNPFQVDDVGLVLGLWLMVSTIVCLIGLSLLTLNNQINMESSSWIANFSAVFYFLGTIISLQVFTSESGVIWRCTVMTIVSFVPLVGLGVITGHIFPVVLGLVGFLLDIWIFTEYLFSVLNASVVVPLQFFVFAFSGVGLGVLVASLYERQERVQEKMAEWANELRIERRSDVSEVGEQPSIGIDEAVIVMA